MLMQVNYNLFSKDKTTMKNLGNNNLFTYPPSSAFKKETQLPSYNSNTKLSMNYAYSKAQKNYLRRKYAAQTNREMDMRRKAHQKYIRENEVYTKLNLPGLRKILRKK